MSISFSQIPATNPLPPLYYVEFDNANAGVAAAQTGLDLIIGQTVNVVPSVPTFVPSALWAANYFGAGSQLALMAAAVFSADPAAQLWALPLADASGSTAAAGSVSFTGTATAPGTIYLMHAGREVQINVTTGQTAIQIAAAVVAAFNAYLDLNGMAFPSIATVDGTHAYQVDITARNKGLVGNQLFIGLNFFGSAGGESLPAGITAVVTAMTGGAGDPDLGGVAAALGTTPYDYIAHAGYTGATDLNEIDTMMSFTGGRWGYAAELFGHVFGAYQSTGYAGSDILTFGQGRNGPHQSTMGYEAGMPNAPFEVAAVSMAAFAAASKADPARPEQTLSLPNLIAPPPGQRFSFATQVALLGAGIGLMKYHADNSVALMMVVTNYQTNSFGQPDKSYLLATTLYQIMYYVRNQKSNLTQKFPRAKLAADGISFGQQGNIGLNTPSIVTPSGMVAELRAQYGRMCPGGDLPTIVQAPGSYAPVCAINGSNPNRLDVLDDPIMIGGLRMIAVVNQFRLAVPTASVSSAAA